MRSFVHVAFTYVFLNRFPIKVIFLFFECAWLCGTFVERSNAVRNADDAIQNGRGTGMTPNARNGNGVEVSPRSASESVINALQNLELRNNCMRAVNFLFCFVFFSFRSHSRFRMCDY